MVAEAPKFKKILLIDDNPVDNLISQRYISNARIAKECITIDSSLDAYDYLFEEIDSKDFPEVILLDLNMPIYNGFEFLDKIEKLKDKQLINSRVYILSSSTNSKDVQRAKSYKSVVDYFVKPLNEDTIKKIA